MCTEYPLENRNIKKKKKKPKNVTETVTETTAGNLGNERNKRFRRSPEGNIPAVLLAVVTMTMIKITRSSKVNK